MEQFLLDILAQVLGGILVVLILRRWRQMSLPPKAGTSGGYKNCDIPNYVRGLALGVVDGETSTAPLGLKLATNMYGVKRFNENLSTK